MIAETDRKEKDDAVVAKWKIWMILMRKKISAAVSYET